jgi:stalled ribosome rescue protein Dom34
MPKSDRAMIKNIGIWIDQKEAVLVSVEDAQAAIERIVSNVESHFRPSGGWKASGTNVAQSVSKEQRTDERREHQLDSFYEAVIEKAGKADKCYIFGPGEAKLGLVKKIEKIKGQHIEIAAVETSDSLTENQIVAKVKAFFKV